MPLDALLKLIDDHYCRGAPTKGSHAWFNPKTIYITSNLHPKDWYIFLRKNILKFNPLIIIINFKK